MSFTHEDYGRATSISTITSKWSGSKPNTNATVPDEYYKAPVEAAKPVSARTANATLLMLARNSDLDNVIRSMRRLEDRFNVHYKYPWVFLNDVEFSEEFK